MTRTTARYVYMTTTVEVAAYTQQTETHVDVFYSEEKVTAVEAMIYQKRLQWTSR